MKRWIFAFTFLNSTIRSATTILQLEDFHGPEAQKKQMTDSISSKVKQEYFEKTDMCRESNLQTMEKKNLESFQKMTRATQYKAKNTVIHYSCEIMIYATITTAPKVTIYAYSFHFIQKYIFSTLTCKKHSQQSYLNC
jgi:hypothetical protein